MENLTHALYMAFAMMAFVLAFSVSLYLVNKLNSTTETIVYGLNGAYYDSFSLGELINENEERNRSRIVGIDSIIPTLYRYYKESFSVKILDESGDLLQYFDTTTETEVNKAISEVNPSNSEKALLSIYDNDTKPCYMAGAPWLANITKDAKTRVDMYVFGRKGYINNVLVDYESRGLNLYENRKFKEIFTQYAYEGDTITDEEDELVTLTGSKQISTKIIIIYQLIPDTP